jgi:hypothetical protein
MQRKEGAYLSCLLLLKFLKKKKKKHRKQIIEKKIKCKERKELTFFLSLLHLG